MRRHTLSPGDEERASVPVRSGRWRGHAFAPLQQLAGPLVDREVDHGSVDRDGADALTAGGFEGLDDRLGPGPLRPRWSEGVVDQPDLIGMDAELAPVAELAGGPGGLPETVPVPQDGLRTVDGYQPRGRGGVDDPGPGEGELGSIGAAAHAQRGGVVLGAHRHG